MAQSEISARYRIDRPFASEVSEVAVALGTQAGGLTRSSLTLDVFRGNPAIWWSALALIALQLFYTYVPFMNDLFGSRPLAIWSWGLPFVLSIAIFLAVELLKLLRRRGDDAARAALQR